jgi:hypothetical protein
MERELELWLWSESWSCGARAGAMVVERELELWLWTES